MENLYYLTETWFINVDKCCTIISCFGADLFIELLDLLPAQAGRNDVPGFEAVERVIELCAKTTNDNVPNNVNATTFQGAISIIHNTHL